MCKMAAVIITILRALAFIYNMALIGFTISWYADDAKRSKARLKTLITMIAFSCLNIAFACVSGLSNI